jgi:hypothetical protein
MDIKSSEDSDNVEHDSASSKQAVDGEAIDHVGDDPNEGSSSHNRRQRIRKRVSELARRIVQAPINAASSITPMPQAVASVLKDATLNAVDLAVEEGKGIMLAIRLCGRNDLHVRLRHNLNKLMRRFCCQVLAYRNRNSAKRQTRGISMIDVQSLIDEAFLPLETTLEQMESQLTSARSSLVEAKQQAIAAIEAVEAAAIAQAEATVKAVQEAEKAASRKVLADIYVAAQKEGTDVDDNSGAPLSETQLSQLAFEDVDYGTSEMAPPFLGEDQCLVPGEPVARVEKAPENSRRIFAGIDILASVEDVWTLLTDYAHLQDVVPNLVVNEVLEEYNTDFHQRATPLASVDASKPEEVQCQELANQMKGAKLRQVGGAKVAGIRFSARTTLEVREWPNGLPDFAHFNDEYWQGKSRRERAKDYTNTALTRYRFPRPFAVSKLPTRDISMQSIVNDDGEFRMYQGVWRMQPLPGCAPAGKQAMRLTYAVEVSPRAYLPVQLVEGRIVRDLCTNLVAIRDFLAKKSEQELEALNRETSTSR